MELQLVRSRTVSMFVIEVPVAANNQAAYTFHKHARIVGVRTRVRSTGGTSGATTVDGKVNGVSIFSAVPSIAFNAASKERFDAASALPTGMTGSASVISGSFMGEPAGFRVHPGDRYQVDVTAVPGAAAAGLSVDLELVEEDV